jgi:hypothetical protein
VRAESLNDRWTLPESSATQPVVSQYDAQVYKPRVLPKGHDPAKAKPLPLVDCRGALNSMRGRQRLPPQVLDLDCHRPPPGGVIQFV